MKVENKASENVSPTGLKAMLYLHDHPGARRSQVGYHLFGGGVGAKSNRAREGGSVLCRLHKLGLVRWDHDADSNQVCYLTVRGHELLEATDSGKLGNGG